MTLLDNYTAYLSFTQRPSERLQKMRADARECARP